jgi:group II intron reverse transcriptase/maturase
VKTQRASYEKVRSLQRKLYRSAKADGSRSYGVLYDKVMAWDTLCEAWARVSRNRGSSGVDGVSIDKVKNEIGVEPFLGGIQEELAAGRYEAPPVKRSFIPKGDGKMRPLGVPTVRDRVVQAAVKLVIEPLLEADFCDCSHGFRPKRSNVNAARVVHQQVNYRKYVVVTDLKQYFDTINHDRLMTLLRRRIRDRRVLHLIRNWLKAGIMNGKELSYGTAGTPQGGVLSPLLSNLYLNELDRVWNDHDGKLIRFADDFVVLCRTRTQAERAQARIRERLAELELTVNDEKSHVRELHEGFDFLGFCYKEAWSERSQRLVRIRFPRPKGLKAARARIKERLKKLHTGATVDEAVVLLNRSLRGWGVYFRHGNSYRQAHALVNYACEQLRIFCRRRHQTKRTRGYKRWSNAFFLNRGLYNATALLA